MSEKLEYFEKLELQIYFEKFCKSYFLLKLTWSLGPVCCWYGSVGFGQCALSCCPSVCSTSCLSVHHCISHPFLVHHFVSLPSCSSSFILHSSCFVLICCWCSMGKLMLLWLGIVVGVAWGNSCYFGVCFCWCSMGETPMLLCTWFQFLFALCGRDHWAGFVVRPHLIGSPCMDFPWLVQWESPMCGDSVLCRLL